MKKTITKRRIALLQLVRAIELLEDKNDPVRALTLAAAAEEILGKISSAKVSAANTKLISGGV